MDREVWIVGIRRQAPIGDVLSVYFQSFEEANAFIATRPTFAFLERYHAQRKQARTQESAQTFGPALGTSTQTPLLDQEG